MLSSQVFFDQTSPLSWLVKGVLVADQFAVLAGPPESLITNIGLDLALSLASGTPFLNKFPVPNAVRVGFFSCEFQASTVAETAKRIARSKELDEDDFDVRWACDVPPLDDDEGLAKFGETIVEQDLGVVVIDPIHTCLVTKSGLQASNIFEISPLLARVTRTCLNAGATLIATHHTRKNAKPPLDVEDLAQCGIGEAARQRILVSRRSPFIEGCGVHQLRMTIGGSAGFSSVWAVDLDEGLPGENLDGRRWLTSVRRLKPGAKSDRPRRSYGGGAQDAGLV